MRPRRDMVEGAGWVLVFAGVVFVGSLWAMTAYRKSVAAADIVALAAAVLGVVGTHMGHVTGRASEERRSRTERIAGGLERLAALHDKEKLTKEQFEASKSKLLG